MSVLRNYASYTSSIVQDSFYVFARDRGLKVLLVIQRVCSSIVSIEIQKQDSYYMSALDRGLKVLLVIQRVFSSIVSIEMQIASVFSILMICVAWLCHCILTRWETIASGSEDALVQRISVIGGYKIPAIDYEMLKPYLPAIMMHQLENTNCSFQYIDHTKDPRDEYVDACFLQIEIPVKQLVKMIPVSAGRKVAMLHGLHVGSRATYSVLQNHLATHCCENCKGFVTIFSVNKAPSQSWEGVNLSPHFDNFKLNITYNNDSIGKHIKQEESLNLETCGSKVEHLATSFPPPPLSKNLAHAIITKACQKMNKENIEEAGCAVCGQLTGIRQLSSLKSVKNLLHVLKSPGFSKLEKQSESDTLKEEDIVIDHCCNKVCDTCRGSLRQGKVPKYALANGLWIGAIPAELSSLRVVERMLVAKVRHSCCSIKIASGMRKMKANAIAFPSPVLKVYDMLPPPKDDIEEVLAIMFTGPCKPTAADFMRTPFLVRRNHVKRALEWLILNHGDYTNVKISDSNLQSYPEDIPPVSVEFKQMDTNKTAEGTSVFDVDEEDGTEEGMCSFTVHGLTGEQLNIMSVNALKAKALHHLNNKGKILAVGHGDKAESIWKNPQLYPQMFPWLFPYGLGGIGSVPRLSDHEHKRRLLMYHDKRFQTDPNFPFVAFSHDQVKTATTNGFLLAEKHIFKDISTRLLNIDNEALNSLLQRMKMDDFCEPTNEAENQCFQLIRDLDHVSGTVKGSSTSKKWMRNEIWSLVAHCGAPFWYITLSPADVKHPICLYYAGNNEVFEPSILPYDERLRRICNNPVASARFFHFVVQTFITDVLAFGTSDMGLYGQTKAFYGTVEQQGRLALHLHIMLWIKGNLTPQEMRDLILDANSEFQQKIIEWIESCQVGEFLTGTQNEVLQRVQHMTDASGYKDPTETLPEAPPTLCPMQCNKCQQCVYVETWWKKFELEVDDIVSKSNIHNCERGINKNGTKRKTPYVGCKDNKYGTCKARFPRPTFDMTEIDANTGALNLKKGEAWLNFYTTYLTYIFRCNTDVTSMWSGTALKAVIVYISDYITKSSLKTHVVFDAIKSIFDKHRDILGSSLPEKEKARQLLTKMVNLLATKTEMGGPMVCMYLLDQPDHYTSHKFVCLYWKAYVKEVQKAWDCEQNASENDKVTLIKVKGRIVGISPVYDYIYRPIELENLCLYDWIRRCERKRLPSVNTKRNVSEKTEESDDDCNEKDYCEMNYESEAEGMIDEDENRKIKCKQQKLPKHCYNLKEPHPLCETHVCHVKPARDDIVVNFIGGVLPRCDQGDYDYYCLTMLTLFKPWRSGYCLKDKDSCWDETFVQHAFSDRQHQLMKNFNIKYECLDARDDYRAKMKAGQASAFHMFGEENRHDDNNDDESQILMDEENLIDGFDSVSMIMGNKEMKQQREMAEIRAVLKKSGWMNDLSTHIKNRGMKPIIPTVNLAGHEWKAVVQLEKEKEIERRKKHEQSTVIVERPVSSKNHKTNQVRIIDKSYLEKKHYTTQHEASIISLCSKFNLNEEQERVFKIITHHVIMGNSDQLKMYIGGMGGTGKSQVIKAIAEFFSLRNEGHRFICVAPTGSAAALLSGSTYHSVFGIHELGGSPTEKVLAQVRTRMQGVDYVFFDEVSMLSCFDLYRISSQLARVLNRQDLPFGGINIIFAGDFGQLPPPIGGENVSLYSRTIGQFGTSLRSQEEAMGKAVWHQVTTVVILRKNMRQQADTDEDKRFRRALENMRYKDCTPEDIQFLRSRITSVLPGKPSISDEKFRNVSVITAKNCQKDEINRLGCIKFAQETGQDLTVFYSEDTLKDKNDEKKSHNKRPTKKITTISADLQNIIWDLPHSSGDKHVPGKLSLCLGLPVIIKCNVATELCITNGQEGIVVGWQSTKGSRNQLLLDTLFIELINPPRIISLKGLPENVIPLSRTLNNITSKLPDDSNIHISRSQVEILPNFAMTDFASQGKTRPSNPVDLFNCRSHQAYYTALSRSATADGTIILQGFDARKITGRASSALRQEFRELELLDEITKLQYESKLPPTICGERRNTLIHNYRSHKGLNYVPSQTHPSIKWNKTDPMLDPIDDNVKWHILNKTSVKSSKIMAVNEKKVESINKFIPAKGSVSLKSVKRKFDENYEMKVMPAKKNCKRVNNTEADQLTSISTMSPAGVSWKQNSCAYDSALTVLHGIWNNDKYKWSVVFNNMNEEAMTSLLDNFRLSDAGMISFNACRDNFRQRLEQICPERFELGNFTSISDILEYLLATPICTLYRSIHCYNGHIQGDIALKNKSYVLMSAVRQTSVQSWLANFKENIERRCNTCMGRLYREFKLIYAPPLIVLDFSGLEFIQSQQMVINTSFNVTIDDNEYTYKLRGIIYYGDFHFTSRIIYENGMTWFHDGMITMDRLIYEGVIENISNIGVCRGKHASVAFYTKC